jgi:hypothetical protein
VCVCVCYDACVYMSYRIRIHITAYVCRYVISCEYTPHRRCTYVQVMVMLQRMCTCFHVSSHDVTHMLTYALYSEYMPHCMCTYATSYVYTCTPTLPIKPPLCVTYTHTHTHTHTHAHTHTLHHIAELRRVELAVSEEHPIFSKLIKVVTCHVDAADPPEVLEPVLELPEYKIEKQSNK